MLPPLSFQNRSLILLKKSFQFFSVNNISKWENNNQTDLQSHYDSQSLTNAHYLLPLILSTLKSFGLEFVLWTSTETSFIHGNTRGLNAGY